MLEGEVVLVTDDGEEVLHAGDSAGFKAGDPNGHHFQNRSAADVVLLEIGSRGAGADSALSGHRSAHHVAAISTPTHAHRPRGTAWHRRYRDERRVLR